MTEGFCRRLLCAATAAAACALVIGMPPVVARAQDADPPPQAAGPAAETGIPPSPWDDVAIDFGVRDEDVPPPTPVNETPARTVELLAAAMNEATGPRRARLLAEIGGCKLPQSVPHVRAAIDDPDPLVRREAVRSAGVLADATLRDTLGKFLADPDPAVRRDALVAAHAIDTAGDSSAGSPAVAAALADSATPTVVLVAALRRAAPADVDALAALLPKAPKTVQPETIRALGRLKATAHAGAVAALLSTDDVAVRAAALAALREVGTADHLEPVTRLLAHEHPTVRREALAAVGRLAPVADRQTRALAALKDPDPSVRVIAADILGRHPSIDAVPELLAFLADPHPALHGAALAALANPASPEMRELVSDRAAALLDDADRLRRIDGSFLLGRLRSDKNVARHLSFLHIKEPPHANDLPLMAQAAESLGRIGVREAGPLVAAIARRAPTTVLAMNPKTFLSDDASVAAFVAGGKLGEPGVLPEAKRLLGASGQPTALRASAVFALGTVPGAGDADANAALLKLAADEGDSGHARYEAIKALVRRQVPGTLELVTRLSTTSPDPYARYAAHWAAGRLGGKSPGEYVPPTRPWVAATSISDLPPGE